MSTPAKLQQVVEIALADQFWTYADTQSLAKERSDAARAALRDLVAQADRAAELETAFLDFGDHASWRCGHPDRYPHFPDCPCGLVGTWRALGFKIVKENDGSAGIVRPAALAGAGGGA